MNMDHNITPRIAVMSYKRLTEVIKKTISPEKLKRLIIINSSFGDTKDIAEKLWVDGTVDVFVSGSSNLVMLKEKTTAPVVAIQISGFDILNNLVEANKKYGNRIVIVSYKEPIANITTYKDIINVNVEEKCYNSLSDLVKLLKSLKEDSVDVVIGSSIVCDLCDELNINSIFIYSSDSIKSAIDRAIQMQQTIEADRYRSIQFDAIIKYAYSGIIAIDEKCKVQVYNPMAENIIGVPKENMIGKYAQNAIENTRLHDVLISGKQELNQFQRINGRIILTNRVPINVEGKVKGVVATFQDINSIQNAERKIRRELYSKGLIAKYSFSDIKGSSNKIKNCIHIAQEYAKSEFSILIIGETGTGKELFAQSIHNYSRRHNEAFVSLNCASFQENLLESELFGYEEGAFTGAKKGGKIGIFEIAHHGTIFLDEISEIPLNLQARLLRVLQEKEVMRLGSDKIIPVDVRIISATNKDLWSEVINGRFREDLYYRLNALEIRIPPLRERKEDIPEIARSFIFRELPDLYTKYKDLWEEVFSFLQRYNFYGNIRELQNVLKRLSVLIASKSTINFSVEEIINIAYDQRKIPISNNEYKKNNELDIIVNTLKEFKWNKEKTAEKLGMSRTTLWRKMKTYGIK